jgi:predicted nuclease of predicted toxin-antitoxin system
MNIKLDENIPLRAKDLLYQLGHKVDTVIDEGLAGFKDDLIWEAAQENGCFLITQDLDFSNIQKFLPGTHHGLLILRLRNCGRQAILDRINSIFQTESIDSWQGCFIIATERKIRIRKA